MREQLHFMLYFNKHMEGDATCRMESLGSILHIDVAQPQPQPISTYLHVHMLFLWVKSRFVVNTSNFNQAVFSEQSRPWWPWIMPFHASCSQVISYRCWPFTAPCFKTLAFFFSLVVILSSIGEIGWWGEDMAEKQITLYVSYMLSC